MSNDSTPAQTQSQTSSQGAPPDKLALLRQMEAMMSTFAQIVKLIAPQAAEAAPAAPSQAADTSSKTVQASRVLLESADKLKELLNRPEGTDLKETAQKLGQIVEETSSRIDALIGQKVG
ncbi:hypothetical protein [Melittangium boletus]|uniref:Uncharacterized protein n=1 Tax=Melittangium boletus DSM 14713 TaxID=1294270 RepID=A0A250IDN7_9BACT|nr:hypothetical protein [Melittangium boletus]ATB29959.1 hypothetical protein MEBOL_003414 [Melittangium boletus DSM 14713]